MELINIIVHDQDTGIVSINTFAIVEQQLRSEVVEEAEEFFKEKCIELKFGSADLIGEEVDDFVDELNEHLNDGYWEFNGSTVSFVWSYPENI